ncbi:signal transduction histidine kinase [Corynebacterium variabile DSM 44702]|uniref:Signal transduction histidine kinase n=1 Tax=Corynebacterium variabile (strain DSM 44702 / CIP 107183 / JCM 12073 / NCIMB 30131) TaxID=858619 RepID=G0HC65_CORVD|nr:tape measure protein [Corynebacterium variabile]AEK36227.1 signal transduction histidine kinase [Corynebacterium variabile DSM 44702]
MALDLGTLFATLDIKDDGFTQKLSKAKTELQELSRTAEKAGKSRVDITPKGAAEVQKAKSSASELGRELENAGKAKPNIAPTGTGSVTAAAGEARTLARELDSARQAAKQVVFPQNLSNEVGAVGKATGSLVDSLGSVSSKAIKWGAMTAGASAAATAVGGVGLALTKGFQRLDSIDQANAKLTGLGHSAEAIEGIMDSAMASVKGTAFGFGEAAGLAGQMVASGIEPGEELTQVLTTVADTAAIGGRSLEDMGLIFGSVAARGKLQGDDLMQLMAGGIPVLQMLADETGKTAEEVSDMASSGEIDFATFESAMRNHLGGAAQAAGDTFSGSMDNAKAAAGRLGAAFLDPMFDAAPGIIGNITDKIDDLAPQAEAAGAKLSEVAQGAIPHVKAALDTLKGSAETAWPVVQKIGDVAMGIPWQAYAGVIAMAVSKHQGLTGALSSGSGKFKTFTTEVAANRAAMQQQGQQIGVVSAAIQTLGTKSSTIGKMSSAFQSASTPLRVMGMDAKDAAKQTTGLGRAAKTVKGGLSSFGGVLSGSVAGGFSLAKSGAKGLMTALGGPWGLAIGGATAVIGTLIAKHQEAKAAEEEHKRAQQELRDSLDDTTGAITDQTRELQIKSLEESGARDTARDLNISDQTLLSASAGNATALREIDDAIDRQATTAVNGTEFWDQYGASVESAGMSLKDFGSYLTSDTSDLSDPRVRELADQFSGIKDSMSETEYKEFLGGLEDVRSAAKDSSDELRGFRESLGGQAEMTGEAQLGKMEDNLRNLQKSADQTKDAFKILGDAQFEIKDSQTISVATDDMTEETRKKLEEIGAEVSEPFQGKVDVTFPEGMNLLDSLGQLGVKAKIDDGYIQINREDLDGAQEGLELLGLRTKELPGGRIVIDSDDPEVRQRMIDLGILVEAGADGDVRLSDNTNEVQGRIDKLKQPTSSTHTVYITEIGAGGYNQVKSQGYSDAEAWMLMEGRAGGGRLPRHADGARHGGYRLPTSGPGTGVVDGILGVDGMGAPTSWVDAGEWIVNGDRSEQYDSTLAAINSGSPMQVMASLMRDLDHHATGGRVSQQVKSGLSYMDGTPYIFGGWSPSGVDCSGAISLGVNRAMGLDDFDSRCGTASEGDWLAAKGFQRGKGNPGDIRVAWYNGGPGGGHTAMELGDGTFIESGGNTGGGFAIGRGAGPLEGRGFTDWMFLPSDGGDESDGSSSDSASSSSSGNYASLSGSSSSSSSGPSKSINGGNGPLIKDGSALEFAAAAYAAQTGTPMPDDVVSWGQVMGVGTEYESDNIERDHRQSDRDMRQNERDIEQAKRDIEEAKADIAEKEKALAESKPEDKDQAQRDLDDARDKVPELEDKLGELIDKTGELQKTNEQLRIAVERQGTSTPSSAGQVLGLTAMADGGILGSARNAQIAGGSSAVLWNEAGPEAYIPLSSNKRARSIDIWAETGKRLGIDVMSMLQLVGSGIPGLMDGDITGFSTGGSVSLDAMGLNTDAAAYRGAQAMAGQQVVGAVFNGPVQVNDPRQWVQGQVNGAGKMLGQAMKGVML